MKYVFVIPARGGSKRLPRKNVLLFKNKPLIAHTILYALDEIPNVPIYVSTDNEEIASISKTYHAEVICRPTKLANDISTTAAAVKHAAQYLINKCVDYDYIILLQATNPLRPKNMLKEAIAIIDTQQCDSLATYSYCNRKLLRINAGKLEPVNYYFGQRSQDMEKYLYENGLLYIISREQALNEKVQDRNTYPLIVNHPYGEVDIDTEEDFKIADLYYDLYHA